MKNLKIGYFILFTHLFACQAYRLQLVTLQSNQLPFKGNQMVYETDTLLLSYNLYNQQNIIEFTIYNKLNVPLYVDWKNSALIVGKEKMDYWIDQAELEATTYISPWLYNISYTSGTINKAERIAFIPPQTQIKMSKFRIIQENERIALGNASAKVDKIPANLAGRKKKVNIFRCTYQETDSPHSFRNFLTFALEENFQKPFYIDSKFWVATVEEVDKEYLLSEADIKERHIYQSIQFPESLDRNGKMMVWYMGNQVITR